MNNEIHLPKSKSIYPKLLGKKKDFKYSKLLNATY